MRWPQPADIFRPVREARVGGIVFDAKAAVPREWEVERRDGSASNLPVSYERTS